MVTGSLDDALELAVRVFRGVTDKGGQPYILHLLRVMLSQEDSTAQVVGLLHDIVEDTSVTLEELRRLGFADEIVTAVDSLTHRSNETYAEYILRVKLVPLARRCKLADLQDNYRLERVAYRDGNIEVDAKRVQRYILSFQFLTDKINLTSFLRLMKPLE